LDGLGEGADICEYLDVVVLDGYHLIVAYRGCLIFSIAFGDDDVCSIVLEDLIVSVLDEFEVQGFGFVFLFDGKIVDSEFDRLCLPFVSFHLNEISIDQIEFIIFIVCFLDSQLSGSDDFGLCAAIDFED